MRKNPTEADARQLTMSVQYSGYRVPARLTHYLELQKPSRNQTDASQEVFHTQVGVYCLGMRWTDDETRLR